MTMKKQYENPKLRVGKLRPSTIICVSFGEGETTEMHAKQNTGFLDREDDFMEEQ